MDIQATDEYKALEIYLQKAQEEIGRSFSVNKQIEPLSNGFTVKRHNSFSSDLDGNHSYWQHVRPGHGCKRHNSFSSYSTNNDCDSRRTSSENLQNASKRNSDPSRSKSDEWNGQYQCIIVEPGKKSGKEINSQPSKIKKKQLMPFRNGTDNRSILLPSFSQEYAELDDNDNSYTCDNDDPWERNSEMYFPPPIEKIEKIISSTLIRNKGLQRASTTPNFSTGKNAIDRTKYQKSKTSLNSMDDSNRSINSVNNRNIDNDNDELYITENDIYKSVCRPKRARSHSTTGIQTSIDENFNFLCNDDKDLSSQSIPNYVTTGTNTTDSLQRPKKKGKIEMKSNGNCVQCDSKSEDRVPVQKPNSFPEKLQSVHMSSFIADESPEMQVVVNTTSPVIYRRSRQREKIKAELNNQQNEEDSNLPEVVSPIKEENNCQKNTIKSEKTGKMKKVDSKSKHSKNSSVKEGKKFNRTNGLKKMISEKFVDSSGKENDSNACLEGCAMDDINSKQCRLMKKELAKTWHGIGNKRWKRFYSPVAQAVWDDLEGQTQGDTSANTQTEENFKLGSSTMPNRTLLDQMHKKYCAYQYKDHLKLPSPDDLVMSMKLKSSPPPPDRMKSKAWIMRHYIIPPGKGAISTPSSPDQAKKMWMCNEREITPTESETSTAKNSPDISENETERLIPAREVEVEAVEATRWLKEAGFPQYAQMYEDGQFPVDITSVEKDHDFLDSDSMQPLIRRLSTLNKCAIMRIVTPTRKHNDDSDDDEQCALSDKWKYQPNIRRWSRKGLKDTSSNGQPGTTVKSSSSNDSLLADQNSSSETGDSPVLDHKMHHDAGKSNDDLCVINHSKTMDNGISSVTFSPRLRRAASERIKGAKNFLKRVESLKSRKSKRLPKTGNSVEISGPVITDNADMKEKIKHLNCKDLSPTVENMPLPEATSSPVEIASPDVPEPWSNETTNYKRPTTGPVISTLPKSNSGRERSISNKTSAMINNSSSPKDSDSGNSQILELDLSMSISDSSSDTSITSQNGALLGGMPHERFRLNRWNDSSDLYYLPQDYVPGKFPKTLLSDYDETGHGINLRTGSFSYRQDNSSNSSTPVVKRRGSANPRVEHRGSFYDNVPLEENLETAQEELDDILHKLFQDINGLNKAIYGEDAEEYEPPQFHHSTSNVTDIDDIVEADDSLHDDNDITNGTVSSPDNSDHDLPDSLHDDSAEHIECRERRDSGVGSSLTRAPSDRRRNRIRWHSFQKSHRPSFGSQNVHITNLSVCQLMVLQKLSLCKLTGLIEKYSQNRSGWSWTVPRFMKRHKIPDYKERNVFEIPLLVTLQRTGQPLPQCMLYAMRYLRKTAKDAVGIFRKAGVRSRIQKLKNDVEANPDTINFEDLQAYDVADLLKQYFRELPECLMTNKLSEIFLNVFISLPAESRLEALQSTVILLPDENREVLQSLLYFLADISQDASEHQMTASNLAVCFAPSLFSLNGTKSVTASPSPRRPRKNLGVPDARELLEQKAAHECLTTMITDCKELFMISEVTMSKCRFSYIEQGDPISLQEFNNNSSETEPGYHGFVDTAIQALLKESHDKFRGWVSVSIPSDVDVSFKKVGDGHPLRLWKCCVDVEAPPEVVLERVRDERHIWDDDLLKWYTVEKLDHQTDVFHYERNSLPPHPTTNFCVLRGWRTDLVKGSCALVTTSVEHPKVETQEGIQGVVLVSHFLIEPCGTGKSRIIFMSRVDLRGRTADWYKKSYGYFCAGLLERIKDSFKQSTSGPESIV